jgi:phasin family protein
MDMAAQLEAWTLAMWKQQLGRSLRLAETIVDQSRKLREHQLAAAVQAHADAVATRESLAGVTDPGELWRLQNEWLSQTLQASAAYWRRLYEIAAETQGVLATCACEPMTESAAPATSLAVPAAQRKAA